VIARACAAAALLLLALPAAGMAKTKTVDMGIPPASANAFQDLGVDVNDFFPHTVTVNVGDRVRFRVAGFHSFDFPPRGGNR
jgi:plastocyanin